MLSVLSNNNLGVLFDGNMQYPTNLPYQQLEKLIGTNKEREVFCLPLKASEENWNTFRSAIIRDRHSPNAIQRLLNMSFPEITVLPLLVYGGVDRAIYLRRQADVDPRNGVLFHLFADNDVLYRVFVNVILGTVKIESGNAHGHFILPEPT